MNKGMYESGPVSEGIIDQIGTLCTSTITDASILIRPSMLLGPCTWCESKRGWDNCVVNFTSMETDDTDFMVMRYCHSFIYRRHSRLPSQTFCLPKPGDMHPSTSFSRALVEEAEDLAGDVLPPGLLVVHDAS